MKDDVDKNRFSKSTVMGVIAAGIIVLGLGYYILKDDSVFIISDDDISVEKKDQPSDPGILMEQKDSERPEDSREDPAASGGGNAPIQPTNSGSFAPSITPTSTNYQKQETPPKQSVPPEQNVPSTEYGAGGYSFEVKGYVYDVTDAPAMTNGTPVAGIVLRASGPKSFTTQTRADGFYALSFTAAPLGTYDVCFTIPPGYRTNPPSGCASMIVKLSEKYVKTLELMVDGNSALHWTAINFHILRQ